jgi:hypothetical protein
MSDHSSQNTLNNKITEVKNSAQSLQSNESFGQEIADIVKSATVILGSAAALVGNIESGNIMGAVASAGVIMEGVNKIIPEARDVVSKLEDGFEKALPEVEKFGSDILNFIENTASTIVSDVGSTLNDAISGKFGQIPSDLEKTIVDVKKQVVDGVGKIENDAKALMDSDIVKELKAGEEKLPQNIKDMASKVLSDGMNKGPGQSDIKRSEQQSHNSNKGVTI